MEDVKEICREEELQEFHSSVGYNLAERRDDLDLLATESERKYFLFLCRTIPNITNIDIISICNLACLLATLKKLNEFMGECDENIELYLKLLSKRNETVTKIDLILKSYGLTGTTKGKIFITYDEEEGD
ncbi:hypothetical protein ACV30B_14390 [Clostridium perfringens]|uniref:hypothetical protein n=1 Tax=Clostridium perfringens TaxID=1502 RepID=UPI0018E4AD1F|nr:hypothetical protein [Clostridium perfringens]ELC8343609.1 hypothetical protein [Clostridium perfringens]ELC8390697.1 hypothetical protein [Clostridium perfringens]ELC8391038.1 hypothetical protein [Clostridium perfringens]MBI6049749.1 hypothetical protein [Clostridium perfringens]MBI6081252.1 hypothetical protein [Clostridium perfringens]